MAAEKSRLIPQLLVGVALIAVVGAGALWFSRAPERPAAPAPSPTVIAPPTPTVAPVAAVPLSFAHKTAQAEVALKLPAAIAAQPELHARLYADGVRELKAFSESEGAVEEHDDTGSAAPAFSHAIAWTAAAETGKLLSLRKQTDEFAGGAHPITSLGGLLWDKAMKKPLTPEALLRKGADFAGLDRALCDAVISAKQARLAAAYQPPGQGWQCPKWAESAFVLAPSTVGGKAGGLTFLFAPYAVGAYAEGPYEVTVPLRAFSSELAPAYADDFAGVPAKGR